MTDSEKHSVEKQTILAVVAETATVEEREQIGESWQALSQLLKAHQPALDDAQLIAQVSQRMHRRHARARTRLMAIAAFLVLFVGWLGVWIIGPTERNAQPVAAASTPLEQEAMTASKLLVPNKASTDTAASLNVEVIAARSDGLDWDDNLTEELAMAQQQVWSLQTNTTSSEAAYLQQRMSLLEDDLNNEAL